MLKQITLAALAATFIAGSAAVANAESGVGVAAPNGAFTEGSMQSDYAANHGGDRALSSEFPRTGGLAYGYAPERSIHRSRITHTHTYE